VKSATKTIERFALLASLATTTSLIALTASILAPRGADDRNHDVEWAFERLERAMEVRYGPSDTERGERFDTLVSALGAALQNGSPPELREAIEAIQRARSEERAVEAYPASSRAKATSAQDVDDALGRSMRLFTFLRAKSHGSDAPNAPGMMVLVITTLVSALAGICSVLSFRRREGERRAIAEIVGVGREAANDGTLAVDVGRRLAMATRRVSALSENRQKPAVETPAPQTAIAGGSLRETPAERLSVGRIIEIRHDNFDDWTDG